MVEIIEAWLIDDDAGITIKIINLDYVVFGAFSWWGCKLQPAKKSVYLMVSLLWAHYFLITLQLKPDSVVEEISAGPGNISFKLNRKLLVQVGHFSFFPTVQRLNLDYCYCVSVHSITFVCFLTII